MSTVDIALKPTPTGVKCLTRLDGGYHCIRSKVDVLLEVRDVCGLVDDYIDYLMYWYDYDIRIVSSLKSQGVTKNGWLMLAVDVDLD